MQNILNYILTIIPLAMLDALWIRVIAKGFYARAMAEIWTKNINLTPIILFYPLYALGIFFLAVMPALESGSVWAAMWRGAILGLAAYSAYDLTNQATIALWPTKMTLVDVGWGIVVSALTSAIATYIILLIRK